MGEPGLHVRRMVYVRDCGGCRGEGAHSRRCSTQPGWFWYRLEDMADELGDMIGSNDPESANMAYVIAGRMKQRAQSKENQ
jgi:hypothetical protein